MGTRDDPAPPPWAPTPRRSAARRGPAILIGKITICSLLTRSSRSSLSIHREHLAVGAHPISTNNLNAQRISSPTTGAMADLAGELNLAAVTFGLRGSQRTPHWPPTPPPRFVVGSLGFRLTIAPPRSPRTSAIPVRAMSAFDDLVEAAGRSGRRPRRRRQSIPPPVETIFDTLNARRSDFRSGDVFRAAWPALAGHHLRGTTPPAAWTLRPVRTAGAFSLTGALLAAARAVSPSASTAPWARPRDAPPSSPISPRTADTFHL
ncbi:MAG: hypothetical protein IPH03_13755 [Tetrasphaera sp.]|nr:hypothetical protein [Tetrasphaera sp.]